MGRRVGGRSGGGIEKKGGKERIQQKTYSSESYSQKQQILTGRDHLRARALRMQVSGGPMGRAQGCPA